MITGFRGSISVAFITRNSILLVSSEQIASGSFGQSSETVTLCLSEFPVICTGSDFDKPGHWTRLSNKDPFLSTPHDVLQWTNGHYWWKVIARLNYPCTFVTSFSQTTQYINVLLKIYWEWLSSNMHKFRTLSIYQSERSPPYLIFTQQYAWPVCHYSESELSTGWSPKQFTLCKILSNIKHRLIIFYLQV